MKKEITVMMERATSYIVDNKASNSTVNYYSGYYRALTHVLEMLDEQENRS